ncbi:MAG TPA: PHB depolymerase family esterase [Rudaea sp.]
MPALLVMLQGLTIDAQAATTATLPAMSCKRSDTVFTDRFDATAWTSDPSLGSGGAVGTVTRTITVSGHARTYYAYVPHAYTAAHPWPLLLVLHGASGSVTDSPLAAQQTLSDWAGWADSDGFIVLAAVGTQAQGGWTPSVDVPTMSADIDDMTARYNIEQNRVYLWGFSAGAHLAHALGLENTDTFAAYGVSAGSLTQFACTDDGSYPPSCNALLGGDSRKIPVDIHLGLDDPLYAAPYDAAHDPNRFANNGWTSNRNLYYTTFAGGHEYTVDQLGEIWNHLCPNALVP